MERIAVLFGGRSVEHEVSVVTAVQVMENLDKTKYEVLPVYISKDGTWYHSPLFSKVEAFSSVKISESLAQADIVEWSPVPGCVMRLVPQNRPTEQKGWFSKSKPVKEMKEVRVDVVIPALHGTYGEDGSLQGFLELTGVPFTGSGVTGSAVGMDKIVMKAVFKGEDIPVVNYRTLMREDWDTQEERMLSELTEALTFPMFVKPCNLGSSVGISRAESLDELRTAIEVAKHYDARILVEEAVLHAIEINVSVLGDERSAKASLCERPVTWEKFLTYDDKYIRGNFNKASGAAREIPAMLPDGMTEQIQALALKAFHAVNARGLVRVDFLVSEDGKVYVNEINTIPGSFAFYLWEPTGLAYRDLLTRLIEIAKDNAKRKALNVTTFDTDLLDKFKGQKFAK